MCSAFFHVIGEILDGRCTERGVDYVYDLESVDDDLLLSTDGLVCQTSMINDRQDSTNLT